MSEQFTPGNWEADLDSGNIHVGGEQIASAWVPRHRDSPIPERRANARLIAAAPELLAALEKVCAILDMFRETSDGLAVLDDAAGLVNDLEKECVHEAITAAIARATGAA